MLALERISPCAAHWSEHSYREILELGSPSRIALVIEDEGGLRGFLFARVVEQDCELENIVVATDCQHRGMGSKLLEAVVAAARDHRATRIFLEVRESNVAARALYGKRGFAITGRRKCYYDAPPEDALLYTLPLL